MDEDKGLAIYNLYLKQYDMQILKEHTILPDRFVKCTPLFRSISQENSKKRIIFVHGYLGFGSPFGGIKYWGGFDSSFLKGAQKYFDSRTLFFTHFDYHFYSGAVSRKDAGRIYAKKYLNILTAGMNKKQQVFCLISHSMGGAFAEGMIQYLISEGWKVETHIYINAWEPTKLNKDNRYTSKEVIDATITNDWVQEMSVYFLEEGAISKADISIRKESKKGFLDRHRDLIDSDELWEILLPKAIKEKQSAIYQQNKEQKTS